MAFGVVKKQHETCTFIPNIGTHSSGTALTRTAWVQLNPLMTNVPFLEHDFYMVMARFHFTASPQFWFYVSSR